MPANCARWFWTPEKSSMPASARLSRTCSVARPSSAWAGWNLHWQTWTSPCSSTQTLPTSASAAPKRWWPWAVTTRALQDLQLAIELDQLRPEAWLLRGNTRFTLGDYRGAASDCSHALDINAESPAIRLLRGRARHQLACFDGAIQDLRQAATLAPDDTENSLLVGYGVARRWTQRTGSGGVYQRHLNK